ncbi:hypothetical protein [Cryptosporangium phraense]|uniref:Uncharacterized protein n=1 Tax=Cryptosporangium phraense TaxID=2593070 RepID=A0A545AUJ2_9ACTN|nr:hypothetical protein [Cryptosporangium phraense]TQS44973.1 hypothetical protein FL583_10720 [Cryptosporangium phraense]
MPQTQGSLGIVRLAPWVLLALSVAITLDLVVVGVAADGPTVALWLTAGAVGLVLEVLVMLGLPAAVALAAIGGLAGRPVLRSLVWVLAPPVVVAAGFAAGVLIARQADPPVDLVEVVGGLVGVLLLVLQVGVLATLVWSLASQKVRRYVWEQTARRDPRRVAAEAGRRQARGAGTLGWVSLGLLAAALAVTIVSFTVADSGSIQILYLFLPSVVLLVLLLLAVRSVLRRRTGARAWRYVVFSFGLAAIAIAVLALGVEIDGSIELATSAGVVASLALQTGSVVAFAGALVRLAGPAVTTWLSEAPTSLVQPQRGGHLGTQLR